jgi:hypothetical protein
MGHNEEHLAAEGTPTSGHVRVGHSASSAPSQPPRVRTEEALGEANTREQASSKKAVAEGLRRVCQVALPRDRRFLAGIHLSPTLPC